MCLPWLPAVPPAAPWPLHLGTQGVCHHHGGLSCQSPGIQGWVAMERWRMRLRISWDMWGEFMRNFHIILRIASNQLCFCKSAFSHAIHTTPAVLTLSRLIPVALWTWAQVARCRSRHPIWRTWAEMGHLWWWGRRQTPRFFVRFSGWRNSASAPSPILGRLGCPFQRAGWWLRSQFVDHSLIGGFLK